MHFNYWFNGDSWVKAKLQFNNENILASDPSNIILFCIIEMKCLSDFLLFTHLFHGANLSCGASGRDEVNVL